MRDEIEQRAQTNIRDYMPDQHRAFFELLPFVLLGTTDVKGRPWASIMVGKPGFVTTPDAKTIHIEVQPAGGDPPNVNLKPGQDVGLLGIQLETRRRNRANGTISSVGPDGITIALSQSFGNCPQYIQTRRVSARTIEHGDAVAPEVSRSHVFKDGARDLIAAADTLFIATAYRLDSSNPSHGADVSHRGGKPGFVHIEDERSFVFPDFRGNNFFNTIGNIVENSLAGFLFIDFERGDILSMTGRAAIIWNGPSVEAIDGAQRLVRFRANEIIQISNSLNLSFEFGEYSPSLRRTGIWPVT